ncbi:hypothetical protein GALMADRAFT_226550 [Galerina marginata CBS 339.88]|uniref:DUF3533 domain-containing protein n=1 Tax=Galerina marginata (strain CBS 339.88) TaxID=685588 RepID=A0A067SY76_GALM3|nr:hypothetical protein GALMADRAFT_226550 [Galerina marginata CBS 339.88]
MNSEKIDSEVTVSGQDTPTTSTTAAPVAPMPYSVQFLGEGSEVAEARRIYIKILLQRTCIIVGAIFGIFSIYWGALWKIPARSLQGWIVDFDGAEIGQFVTEALSNDKVFSHVIDWRVQRATDFPNGPGDVAAALLDEQCWVAVTINPRSTLSLNVSLTGNASAFNTSSAITAYGQEARNENAFRTLLRPTITTLLDQITHDYAVKIMTDIIHSNNSISSISPDILTRPIYFTLQNIRPFDTPVATAVTFIGLIYLLILSFIVVNAGILARAVSGIERQLTTASLIRVRIISPIMVYLVLSLAYTLLTLFFKLPFERYFGHAGFVLFWMLSWFGMTAAGLALESMMTLLTIKYIQVFLILWIIGNVSVCLWPIDALPVLYNYGHAAPFYQISRGVRSIVFGTKNELGLNFGILTVWIVISCISLPVLQWYRRRGEIAAWKATLPKRDVE